MFKYRAISFPILLALLFYMVAYADKGGIYIYTACAALMIGLAVYELGAMTRKIGFKNFPVISGIAGAMLFSGFAFMEFSAIIVIGIICILFLLTIMASWLFLLLLNNRNNKVVDADKGLVEYSPEKTDYLLSVLGSAGITVILAIPLLFTAVTYFRGVFLFLFLALVTKAMDTGGYIFGKLSGLRPHKILGRHSGRLDLLRRYGTSCLQIQSCDRYGNLEIYRLRYRTGLGQFCR